MTEDSGGVSRRGLMAAVGGAGVGGVAGVVYFGDVLGGGGGGGGDGGDGSTEITGQAPDDDGDASLAELRYLIESYEGRQYTLDVTGFTYADGSVDLSYRSAAAEQSDYERWRHHLNELGHVAWAYGQYVAANDPNLEWSSDGASSTTASGTTSTADGSTAAETLRADEVDGGRAGRVVATIENPYSVEEESETPAQPEQYGVEQVWIGNWLAGNWSQDRLINSIANSRVQSDGGG